MSMTTNPCNNCKYPIFSDDDHTCIVENRDVHHPNQVPRKPHWAILTFPKNPDQGHYKATYRVYFTDISWKQKIKDHVNDDNLFSAFKVSAPAKVEKHVSVDIEINL